MLIFVACIDVIITLVTLILLLFIIEIIIPINVIMMMMMMMMVMMMINACYRFDQWFTHCLSITLQHEINYSLKKKGRRGCFFNFFFLECVTVLCVCTQQRCRGRWPVCMRLPTHTKSPSTQAVTRQHDGHFISVRGLPPSVTLPPSLLSLPLSLHLSLSLSLSLAFWIL